MSDAPQPKRGDIAIVGLAGRFPGARNVDEFWTLVRDGQSAIRRLTDEELNAAGVSPSDRARADYVRFAPVLEGIAEFDAAFFGLSPLEASVMDPAHRLFLQLAWQAFEQAGYAALPTDGRIGVFATSGAPLYLTKNVQTQTALMHSMGEFLVRHTGNDMNFLSTRVSYHMDLRGPSLNVQTACSSALVAVHLACRNLLDGDCDMALAGGATVIVPQGEGYFYREGEILSPDGQCRPFDAASAGTVFGSGAGAVILKRLSDALDHGDTIHAVIKGSAINNDGAAKAGYLAPGVEGQIGVIQSALAAADVAPESVSYVEAHGTGTLVGDPIEAGALLAALGTGASPASKCAIGSVKSNIGHLGEAAGIASLIKAVMALKHRAIPPSLGFKTLNPAIPFEGTRFFVNDTLSDWKSETPRRCGVTALGAGGTNCHVVLEEAPPSLPSEPGRAQNLFVLSAKSPRAVSQMAEALGAHMEADDRCDLADAAWTLATGRRPLPFRRIVVAGTRAEAIARLRSADTRHAFSGEAPANAVPVVFMFPGGGAQYAGMAAELYASEPVFAGAVDACLEIIEPMIGRALRPLMFPDAASQAEATRTLERPSLTLPSLFTIEYALTRLYEHWGVEASASIGHSVGEYVAACTSGVMSLADTLKLVITRGHLFERAEPGSMLSVALSEDELNTRLPARVSIAALNAPGLSVASGPVSALRKLQSELDREGIANTSIRIDVAAHSALLDPLLGEFRNVCRSIRLSAPTRPFISNVTGDWITNRDATDPEYWVRHLRSTVRFADGLATLAKKGPCILLEVGPGRTLTMLAKAQATAFPNAFNCMRHPQEADSDLACALSALGRVWMAGGMIDWTAFYQDHLRNRIPLPVYPFDRQTYWISPGKRSADASSDQLIKRENISDWFHTLGFQEAPLIQSVAKAQPKTWLIFSESATPARKLAAELGAANVVIASHKSLANFSAPAEWTLDFDHPDHFEAALDAFERRHGRPDRIVFLTAEGKMRSGVRRAIDARRQHFLHPVSLIQALGARSLPSPLVIVTSGLTDAGGTSIVPEHAMVLGPAFVAPREMAGLEVRCIDVPNGSLKASARLRRRLIDELRADTGARLVALREEQRFCRSLSPLTLPEPVDAEGDWLRENGVYVITGGLGGIGLEVAAHMARKKPVKLALLGRTGLPEGEEAGLVRARRAPAHLFDRLTQIDALRALGADVRVFACDITDQAALARTLDDVRAAFGAINGVIHAAGVIEDAPLMTKTSDSMARILAPKLEGTRAIDQCITEDLDIFMLFSSVASFLGLPGQVDYAAGNAFLDAFARARAKRAAGRTLVVNWNAWRQIGMAEGQRRRQHIGNDPAHPCATPVFDGFSERDGGREYVATFHTDRDWRFTEHEVKGGQKLLPGTAFVELARAAVADWMPGSQIELSNLTMMAPFQAAGTGPQTLIVQVAPTAQGFEIAMRAGGDALHVPIVTCEARLTGSSPLRRLDLNAIRSRCTSAIDAPADGFLDQAFMNFGPRWANIQSTRFGDGEALLTLALPEPFADDLETFGLHPALLDMATGGVQKLIRNFDAKRDFYVPTAYERVAIYAPMPARVISHVRYQGDGGDGFARFDVTLCDETGAVFADIAHFTMKRLEAGSAFTSRPVAHTHTPADPLDSLLQQAILPEEGLMALERVLAQPNIVQAVISSVDASLWLRQLDTPKASSALTDACDLDTSEADARDDGHEAPATSAERALAKVWSDLLGVRRIGRHDDFFALGGNSLAAVRLFAAIRKQFGATMPMSVLFEAPTLALLAQRVAGPEDTAAASPAETRDAMPLVCIQAGVASRLPLFCIHGGLGNVVGFKPLAVHLGKDQPFYGIQAQGIDGVATPLDSIQDMARLYIRAIKTRQMQGPYLLAGYSGGGVIAHEMVRQLQASGEIVGLLVMIDTLEPSQILKPLTNWDRARQITHARPQQLLRALQRRFSKRPAALPVAEPPTALEVASAEVEKAYFRAQSAHVLTPVACDMVLVRAKEARMHFLRAGRHLGWTKWTNGKIDVIEADGNHETVCLEPAVIDVAAALRARIDAVAVTRAQTDRSPRLLRVS